MAKYERLQSYLSTQGGSAIPMGFEEIERLIEAPLPASARKHRAWWSNNPSNSVITKAWLGAGYRTANVDMGGARLVFRRASQAQFPARAPSEVTRGRFATLRLVLSGTVTVHGDLTAPTGESWSAQDGE